MLLNLVKKKSLFICLFVVVCFFFPRQFLSQLIHHLFIVKKFYLFKSVFLNTIANVVAAVFNWNIVVDLIYHLIICTENYVDYLLFNVNKYIFKEIIYWNNNISVIFGLFFCNFLFCFFLFYFLNSLLFKNIGFDQKSNTSWRNYCFNYNCYYCFDYCYYYCFRRGNYYFLILTDADKHLWKSCYTLHNIFNFSFFFFFGSLLKIIAETERERKKEREKPDV